jgi:hypothetical protein
MSATSKTSLKCGPRGGAIPSGRCTCDDPVLESVKDVRAFGKAFGICSYCGDQGLNLVPFVGRKLHVRCIVRRYGFKVLAMADKGATRARMCCLGSKRMRELIAIVDKKEKAAKNTERKSP